MTAERANLLTDVDRWPLDGGPLIRLDNVSKSFGDNHVLRELSLEVDPGKITVIVGASGSGKSVLMKLINGLISPDEGDVLVFGEDISDMSGPQLDFVRKRVATMFQNYALFDSMTVVENVAFPLVQNNAMRTREANELAGELLDDLGLGDVLREYPAALSGGMKKRVSLARTIVTNPEVVLFDDPTTGLDPIMTEFVDEMLLKISRDYQLTSLVVSHNMASTFRLADEIAVLHEGRIIARGTPDEMRHAEDERVQQFVGRIKRAAIEEVEADRDATDQIEPIVKIRGLHKSFGERKILKGADLTVPKGQITVLIGGSGAGKSVMMKHILGLLQPDEGTVLLFGENVAELSASDLRELRTRIGMLFQHAALFDSMSVADNVAFPLVERRVMKPARARERVDEVLEQLKVAEIADRLPSEISNGQQKRVSLARAIITQPDLMVYDEPTTGQDPIMCDYVEEMIVEAQETFGFTSIIISHDMASTFRIADRVAMLHEGLIIAEGTPYDILHSEDERVREFVFASQVEES